MADCLPSEATGLHEYELKEHGSSAADNVSRNKLHIEINQNDKLLDGGDNDGNSRQAHNIETNVLALNSSEIESAAESLVTQGSICGSGEIIASQFTSINSKLCGPSREDDKSILSKKDTIEELNNDNDIEIIDFLSSKSKPGAETEENGKRSSSKKLQCIVCKKNTKCKYNILRNGDTKHLCDDKCFKTFKTRPSSFLQAQNSTTLEPNMCENCSISIEAPTNFSAVKIGKSMHVLCSKTCMDQFKQKVKMCTTCGKNLQNDANAFLTPIESDSFKDFCSRQCHLRYKQFCKKKLERVKYKTTVEQEQAVGRLSSDSGRCSTCRAVLKENECHSIEFEENSYNFCSMTCTNTFKAKKVRLETCSWCNTEKTNFDMIEDKSDEQRRLFCSLNCLSLFRVGLQANSDANVQCNHCSKIAPAQYHLTMSDASIRNFCSYSCVKGFQNKFAKSSSSNPAPDKQVLQNNLHFQNAPKTNTEIATLQGSVRVIVQPPPPKQVKNKSLICKPYTSTVGTSCRPHMIAKSTQTENDFEPQKMSIPCPIPMIVPTPMTMHSVQVPVPTIVPLPVPVPCFIPVSKKSASGIMKEIRELQKKLPLDHYEAEMLRIADLVARKSSDDERSDEEVNRASACDNAEKEEDMLQIALRLASEMTPEDPSLDLEASIVPAPLKAREVQSNCCNFQTIDPDLEIFKSSTGFHLSSGGKGRGTKRKNGNVGLKSVNLKNDVNSTKRHKSENIGTSVASNSTQGNTDKQLLQPVVTSQPPADSNCVLKFTYGVNAYKHWVLIKNAQIEACYSQHLDSTAPSSSLFNRGPRLFKYDLLQASADELSQALCYFVKEVRKPNGEEYASDSILYLCLGIQQYMFGNGRIDNIFMDYMYEKFATCLNEILSHYEVRLNAQGMLVCRIEEEHLWESKQLGAHSPHVLLNTLVYFNTKYFLFKSPHDHINLSFSHIIKHWKKSNSQSGKQGRSVFLRYYSLSQLGAGDSSQKRKKDDLSVLEQAENVENPLRCPIKLYEFYISKCPESIKNRSDVFYLMPERSCIPDSPVWYSTQPQDLIGMTKMFNRLRVVREIQEAYLANMASIYSQ